MIPSNEERKTVCIYCHKIFELPAGVRFRIYCDDDCLKKMGRFNKYKKQRPDTKLTPQQYNEITKECSICGFDYVVQLHHLDFNPDNDVNENLGGLCPNHHYVVHILKIKADSTLDLKEKLKKLDTFKRV